MDVPQKLPFWQGLYCLDYDSSDFTDEDKRNDLIILISQVALKILEGHLAGQFEKLQGCGAFSFRVNNKGRMKFATKIEGGIPYLLFLEYLPNHEYHRSGFKTAQSVLSAKERPLSGKPITVEMLRGKTKDCEEPILEQLATYRGQEIILSRTQNEILSEACPMMIIGPPGSGKTLLASQLILNRVIQNPQLPREILYLTNSIYLAQEMREDYENSPEKPSQCNAVVTFIDYEGFLRYHFHHELAHLTFATKDDFESWFRSQTTKLLSEDLYQEFPLIFHSSSLEVYKDLGRKQSLLHEEKKGEALELLKSYQTYLKAKGLVDKRLFKPQKMLPRYDFVVVDEAQGFAPAQMELLSQLCPTNEFVVFLDSKQNQYSSLPVRQSTVNILQKRIQRAIPQFELAANFRNSLPVLKVANALLRLENLAIGGELDDKAYTEMVSALSEESTGCAEWVELEDIQARLKQCEGSVEWAIICPKHLKAEVRRQLNTPLIFSFDEVEGLQRRKVIIWGLPDEKIFKEINQILPDDVKETQSKKNNPKDQTRARFAPPFSALHVAITRAEQELYFVGNSTDPRFLRIYPPLKSKMISSKKAVEAISKSSVQDWSREADNLEKAGYKEQAAAIRQEFVAEALKSAPAAVSLKGKKWKKKDSSKVKQKADVQPQPVSNVSLDEQRRIYVEGAAKNIKGNILTTLRHKTCRTLLYETPFSKSSSLFHLILSDFSLIQELLPLIGQIVVLEEGRLFIQKLKSSKRMSDSQWRMQLETYLQNAIEKRDNPDEIKGYLELGINLNERFVLGNYEGWTPACLASQTGQIKILRFLKECGADLNSPINAKGRCEGYTPAYIAALSNRIEVLQFLQKCGVNLNSPLSHGPEKGETLACIAANLERIDLMNFLQGCKVDFNALITDGKFKGYSPIFIAALRNNIAAVNFFHFCGVDLSAPLREGDHKGETLASVAANGGHLEVLKFLHMSNVDLKAPFSDGIFQGLSCAFLAALRGDLGILYFFYPECHSDLSEPIKEGLFKGQTLAFAAAKNGQAGVLDFLHERKVDLRAPLLDGTYQGYTPAFIAARYNHFAALHFLSGCQVDLTAPLVEGPQKGKTPSAIATECGHHDLVRQLSILIGWQANAQLKEDPAQVQ